MSVKVSVDKDGDGTFESEFIESDGELTSEEFVTKTEASYGDNIVPEVPINGWSVSLKSTVPLQGGIESLHGMAVIRVLPSVQTPSEFTLTVSGLPSKKDLHIYTRGYREHEVMRTSKTGELTFILPTATGHQFIIKETEA